MTIAVIAAPLAGLILLLIIVAAMIWQGLMQRRLSLLARGLEGKQYWRICLASDRLPLLRNVQLIWKAHGLLIDDGGVIRLSKVTTPFSQAKNLLFEKQHTSVQWLASNNMMAGPNLDWVRLSHLGQAPMLFSLAASAVMGYPNKDEVRDLALTLFPGIELPPPQRQVFDVWSNRRTIAVYMATMLLTIGAIVDTFAINHASLALVPFVERFTRQEVWLAIPLGILGLSVALYMFFREDKTHKSNKAANALVIALSLFAIATPWAKRVDQWMAGTQPVVHTYKVDASGDLKPWPADDSFPTLLANDLRQHKDAHPTGTEITVELTHGALGLWQVVTATPARSQRDRGKDNARITKFPWELLLLSLAPLAMLIPWQLQKKTMHAKMAQDSFAEAVKGQHFRRVELARPAFLQRRVKLIAFEALGILVDETTHIRLLGQWPDQSAPFDLRVNKADVKFLKNSSFWSNSPARVRGEIATPQGAISFVPEQSLTNSHASSLAKQRSNDLMRSVFPGRLEEMAQHWPFAIESSAMAMAVTFLSLALGGWAALDTYAINPFALASNVQDLLPTASPMLWAPALLLVIAATPWVYSVLHSRQVPTKESAVLAVMLGAGILTASIPAAKRIDRHLANGEIAAYKYVRQASGEFKPQQADTLLPILPGVTNHRDKPPTESDFEVTLIKGRSGLWQYDRVQLMRDVYCKTASGENGCYARN